jgi:pimeloyl-ACP methyl ester carboxylesterase
LYIGIDARDTPTYALFAPFSPRSEEVAMTHGNEPTRRLPILIPSGWSMEPVRHRFTETLAARLRARGHDVTVVPFDPRDMGDVQHYAGHIESVAKRLVAERGVEKLHLLCVSIGGLATLYGIKRGGLLQYTATCTTLGAPFFGARLSFLAHGTVLLAPLRYLGISLDVSRIGRQLGVGSMFLRHLHSDPLPPGLPFVSIAGSRDMICPAKTALLPGAKHHVMDFAHHDIVIEDWILEAAISHCR